MSIFDKIIRRLSANHAIRKNYIDILHEFDPPVIDVLLDTGIKDQESKDIDSLYSIFTGMDEDNQSLLKKQKDEAGLILTLVKSHQILAEYHPDDKKGISHRSDLFTDMPLETIEFEEPDAIILYHTLHPLLISRAKKAESEDDISSAIAANQKLLNLYSKNELSPEVLINTGLASSYLARLYRKVSPEHSDLYSRYELRIFNALKGEMDKIQCLEHIVYASYHIGSRLWKDWDIEAIDYFNDGLDAFGEMSPPAGPITSVAANMSFMVGIHHWKTDAEVAKGYYEYTIGLLDSISGLTPGQSRKLAMTHSMIGKILYDKDETLKEDILKAMDHKESAISIIENTDVDDSHWKDCFVMEDCMSLANLNHKMSKITGISQYEDTDQEYTLRAKKLCETLLNDESFTQGNKSYMRVIYNYEIATHRMRLTEENAFAEKLISKYNLGHNENQITSW